MDIPEKNYRFSTKIADRKDPDKTKTVMHGWWNEYQKFHPDIFLINTEPLMFHNISHDKYLSWTRKDFC